MKITSAMTVRRWLAAIGLVVLAANVSLAQQIEPAEGEALVARGALLVDVRAPEEFAAGHVEGAINIPHLDVEARLAEFGADHEREIVVYCRSGNRSGLAQQSLQALGYRQVFNAGGYEAWLAASGEAPPPP